MTKKGRIIYVPPSILDEAKNIMDMKGYKKRSKALQDLAQYARVGMEAERLASFDFSGMFGIRKRRRR